MRNAKPMYDPHLLAAIKARMWRELKDGSWMSKNHSRVFQHMTDDVVERLAMVAMEVVALPEPTTLRQSTEDVTFRQLRRHHHEIQQTIQQQTLLGRISAWLKPDPCTKCGRVRWCVCADDVAAGAPRSGKHRRRNVMFKLCRWCFRQKKHCSCGEWAHTEGPPCDTSGQPREDAGILRTLLWSSIGVYLVVATGAIATGLLLTF